MEDPEILTHFRFDHLEGPRKEASQKFFPVAHELFQTLPPGREKTKALDRLLEAKDAAVRSAGGMIV